MAILAVKIDNMATLRMNEFFDYAGYCWALSRDREKDSPMAAELEDFYEGTVRSSQMNEIPVLFIYDGKIIGWYKKAVIYRYIRHPALFLEGNVRAEVQNVRLLTQPIPFSGVFFLKGKNYQVIESGDMLHNSLQSMIREEKGPFEVISYARTAMDERGRNKTKMTVKKGQRITAKDRVRHLLGICEVLALEIMEDRCQGISTVKCLKELATQASRYDAKDVNACYYLAMADYQLGFVKDGLRAIDRAIRLEPDADDLLVMKGNLMVSNGCLEDALRCYEAAYEICPDDSYYVMAGRACACFGSPVAAKSYYHKIKDAEVLKDFGISIGKKK